MVSGYVVLRTSGKLSTDNIAAMESRVKYFLGTNVLPLKLNEKVKMKANKRLTLLLFFLRRITSMKKYTSQFNITAYEKCA